MKNIYSASFLHNGALGGGICIKEDKIIYCTNKLIVEEKYRRLSMPFSDISSIEKAGGILPIVSVKMLSGDEYKFLIFGMKSFFDTAQKYIISANSGEHDENKPKDNF